MDASPPDSSSPSRHLLAQADQGSREALDVLFERERARLRRLLALRAGTALQQRCDLDDLVQEAYLEAVRQFASYTYQGRDSFFRWLAALAIHRTNNLRRMATADKRDPKHEVRLAGEDSVARHGGVTDPPAAGPGPRTLTAGAEEEQRLQAALAGLSETDREVILLARVEGLPLAEVAARLRRTRNAVALLLSRALRKLKRKLDGEPA